MKKRKKLLNFGIFLSVFVLLLSSFVPSYVVLAETVKGQKGEVVETQTTENLKNDEEEKKSETQEEILEERTETEKVFDNKDGTFTKQIYQEPINIEDKETKKYEPIDLDIEEKDHELEANNIEFPTKFKTKMENGSYQEVGETEKINFSFKGASTINFSSKDESDLDEQEKTKGQSIEIKSTDREAEISENEITYKDVLPKTDFRQVIFNKSVKEDLVLKEKTDFKSFYFELETVLKPKIEEDGSITFKNSKDETEFEIPRPIMFDSKIDEFIGEGTSSNDLSFELIELTKNVYQLVLTVDTDWLKSDDRVYPIYIDPSITFNKLQNATANEQFSGTNFSGSALWNPTLKAYTLRVGKYDNTKNNIPYFKTDISRIDQASIRKAEFKAFNIWHYYANSPNELTLNVVNQNWDPKKLTWNNRPGGSYVTKTNVTRGKWATFNVTNLVQDWVSGKRKNYGVALTTKTQTDHWKQVIAAENGKNVPYFEVTYTYNKPNKPTVKGTANSDQKTGNLDITWPKIPGATSYQVIFSTGKEDMVFPVGNVTSYSTKGKGLFPTDKEIDEGAFQFKRDGKGTDLAIDPRQFYENVHNEGAKNSLKGQTSYDVRIAAVFKGGTSPRSDFVRTYLPLNIPKVPNAKAYSNLSNESSGYVELNWEPVPLADNYDVLVFNGKEYQSFNVGKELKWTSQGKGIWPTAEEIASGKYKLHTDKKGTELSRDPRPVYKNADDRYKNYTNYWFRVVANRTDKKHASSQQSSPATPSIPESKADKLGMTDFWTSIEVRGGKVNATNGNLILSESDFDIEGRGPQLTLSRTYNSYDEHVGLFGKGWRSTFEDSLELITQGELNWVESDGKVNTFKEKNGSYHSPPGVFSEIKQEKNEDYKKVEEDKSVTIYTKDGKIKNEIDKNNNQLTYSYNGNQLQTIKDASNREVKLSYQKDKLVDSITLPDGKKLSFKYDDKKRLIESKTARGKTYRYQYNDDDQLVTLVEPKDTKDKPQQTTYSYQDQKLVEIKDPVGKTTKLVYDMNQRLTTLTNERGKKISYNYSKAGNPEKTIEDVEGLKLTTTYHYEGNKLVKEVNPKGQEETYKYDSEGNVTSVTDAYGTETFEYNENNDVIVAKDTENKETTIAYSGADALSETDNASDTSNFTKYDQYGNSISQSASLSTGENMVKNSGFELGKTTHWYLSQDRKKSKGDIYIDTDISDKSSLSGKHSVKVISESLTSDLGSTAAAQRFDVEPNTTYTLSADIKTGHMKNSQAFLDVWFIKSDNKTSDGGTNNRETAIRGNNGWVRRQLTFTTNKETRRLGIYLKNEQYANQKGSGVVWFDNVQLEKGSLHSGYNPVENSGIEQFSDQKKIDNFDLTGNTSGISVSSEAFSGDVAVQMTRKSSSDGNGYVSQWVHLNQTKAEPITLTAMSKAVGVKTVGNGTAHSDYSLWADIIYQDGSKELLHETFPTGDQDWNRAAISHSPKKAIKDVKLLFMFRGSMTGTVYFDNLRILEGSRLKQTVYDSKGNYPVQEIDEENRKVSFEYDLLGNKLSETDEKGNKKQLFYNADNQLLKTTLANGTDVNYEYDDNGNIVKREIVSSGRSETHYYEYDADDKVTSYRDPLNRKFLYTYDESGNERSVKRPNQVEILNEYDSADRKTSIKWGNRLAYRFQYDPNGNQTKVTDHINNHVTDKVYDEANRITSVSERNGQIAYTYKDKPTKDNKGKTDKVGNVDLSHGTYQSKVSYDYNALNQNIIVNDGSKRYRFDYDEFGNKTLYTAGNGSMTQSLFDQTNKIKNIVLGDSHGKELFNESYTYDASSNRTSIVQGNGKKTTYKYDAINQLTEEVLPNGEKKSYTYDGFGNRVKVDISGKTSISVGFNNGNQLTNWNGQAFTYDDNGNRLSDGTYDYQWDDMDRLVSIKKKGTSTIIVTYTYDDDGRRLSKKIGDQQINYHYDGDSIDVLYETDQTGKVVRHYIYSDDNIRLAVKNDKETLYYHYNGHGDVIGLTDDTGKLVAEYEYDAWGNILSSKEQTELAKTNPYKYAGYTYDKESNQYYLMARYYNPEQGVFISIDPDPGDDDDPLTMNGYAYGDNNPVMNIDPDGHWVWWAVGGFHSAYSGYKTYKRTKSWKKAGWAAAKTGVSYVSPGGVAVKAWRGGRAVARTAFRARKLPNTVRATNRLGGRVQRFRGEKRFRNKKAVVKQMRIYGRNGKPRVDIHYSNHGNKKSHPYNPHHHIWNRKTGIPNKGTKYPKYNRRFNWR